MWVTDVVLRSKAILHRSTWNQCHPVILLVWISSFTNLLYCALHRFGRRNVQTSGAIHQNKINGIVFDGFFSDLDQIDFTTRFRRPDLPIRGVIAFGRRALGAEVLGPDLHTLYC